MLVTTHSVVAMTVAVKTGNPYIYIPFAILDHLILDQLPHYGMRSFNFERFKILTILDAVAGFFLFATFVYITNWPWWLLFLLCFLAGWPDILWFFGKKKNGFLAKFKHFHKKIQNLESQGGILLEFAIIIFCLWLIVD